MDRTFERPDLRPLRAEIAPATDAGESWLLYGAQTAGAVVATILLFAAFAWLAQRSRRRPLDPSHPAFG